MARLPKSIIKKYGITKKAWSVFRGRSRSRSKSKTKTRSVKKTVRRRYRGRRRRGGGGKSMTRTAFKLIRLGALIGGGAAEASQYGPMEDKLIGGLVSYGGYHWGEKRFQWHVAARVWTPYLTACLFTHGIPKIVSIIRRL